MPDEKIIVHIDPDLEELIPGFLENRNLELIKIRTELDTNNFESITSIGHSLKGVGGGYGFNLMSELGANIEVAAKESNADSILENVNRLEHYLKCIDIQYA